MGVHLGLVNFRNLFYQKSKREPLIINNYIERGEEDKARLNNLIYTKYTGDLMSNMPRCECGRLQGTHLIGITDDEPGGCGFPVVSPTEQNLEAIVWMEAPKGVAAFMNPTIWTMLKAKFTKGGFEIIRWLCDTKYNPAVKIPPIMEQVQELKLPRGYNNFVQNFDAIMSALFELKDIKKKNQIDPLQQLLMEQRDCVFTPYLPLPNRSLLVIEELPVGTFMDPILVGALDAIRTMVGLDTPMSHLSVAMKERRTVKVISQLADFNDELVKNTLARKDGIFRRHIFGTRSHFSFRAVISSLTDQHEYDELHIPWGIGISVLRIHLVNKLVRQGMTANEAVCFLNAHAQKYHPKLDALFKELIAESPYKGIPVVFQRNPSLERGSAQAMFITCVKGLDKQGRSVVDVPTVSLSILSVVGFNADFDGDQLNGTLDLDLLTAEELKALAPHKSVFGLNKPKAVSKNLSIPKPVVATIANWVHTAHLEEHDPEKEALMAQLLEE